jgi:hypothetical protein
MIFGQENPVTAEHVSDDLWPGKFVEMSFKNPISTCV